MKKMSGIIAAAALVGILVLAGSAFAWGGPRGGQGMMSRPDGRSWSQGSKQWNQDGGQWNQGNRQWNQGGRQWNQGNRQWNQGGRQWKKGAPMGGGYYHHQGGRFMMGNQGFCGPMGMRIEIPKEIQDKQTEAYKLAQEMGNEMGKKPMDRAKVEELYKKRLDLRNEISLWRMNQRLDMVEKLQK